MKYHLNTFNKVDLTKRGSVATFYKLIALTKEEI